jgi:hypothetical protein
MSDPTTTSTAGLTLDQFPRWGRFPLPGNGDAFISKILTDPLLYCARRVWS